MTQEDKELLLKDLCARLPYGLVINIGDENLVLDRRHQGIGILYPEDCSDEFNERNNNASFYITISGCYYGEEIKPYLRPMSSMTEKEKQEYLAECDKDDDDSITTPRYHGIEWLNKNMFDYHGLIPMGLAIAVTEENNPYEN